MTIQGEGSAERVTSMLSLMENPATWGPVEKTIDAAMQEAEKRQSQGVVGLSNVRIIADALRAAGLVKE